jgi:hypothetical protein
VWLMKASKAAFKNPDGGRAFGRVDLRVGRDRYIEKEEHFWSLQKKMGSTTLFGGGNTSTLVHWLIPVRSSPEKRTSMLLIVRCVRRTATYAVLTHSEASIILVPVVAPAVERQSKPEAVPKTTLVLHTRNHVMISRR